MWQVLATVAVSLGLTASLTTTAQAVTYVGLYNYKASRCMSLDNGGSTANGTNIVIYDCTDDPIERAPASASPSRVAAALPTAPR